MQYYQDGFYSGDPSVSPTVTSPASAEPDDEVDVLVVGSGPAGNLLTAQLAQFPGIRTRLFERRPGPLELGQADGVACRTLEMFVALGIAQAVVDEGYWVNETTFWRPDPGDRAQIVRVDRVQDVEDGLSEMPHVILNQARVHDHLLRAMHHAPAHLAPEHGIELLDVTRDNHAERPVTATLRRVATGETFTVRTRYLVGADGARSKVRASIGRVLAGDPAGHAWGVMDVLGRTDFPDVRMKSAIQSDAGSILLIPREGGHLVRLYVDLGPITPSTRGQVRDLSFEEVLATAHRVLHPYSFEVEETVWFSIYEVAQRIADGFDDGVGRDHPPRIFIAGDACHTHSAKAGQGMNVSMQDAFNLGWKLAAVLEGRSAPELLESYDAERRPVAQELIDFDREWSSMLAGSGNDAALLEYFVHQGRYTAGVATRYPPSALTGDGELQHLATGFPVGMRFHSTPVMRVADGRRLELGHTASADGRWRLYAFAAADETGLRTLCDRLASTGLDRQLDVRTVLQRPHASVDLAELPESLRPVVGALQLTDYERVFSADPSSDVFDLRGIDRAQGCLVVVRPDQYVAQVLAIDGHDELTSFLERSGQAASRPESTSWAIRNAMSASKTSR